MHRGVTFSPLMWWRLPAMIVLFVCAAISLPFGSWVVARSQFPGWLKGMWKWPLGDNLSPRVAVLQGWANLLIGTSSLVLGIVVLLWPFLLTLSGLAIELLVGTVLAGVLLLVMWGAVLYVWSLSLSYKRPST